jgi:hypothetical protein
MPHITPLPIMSCIIDTSCHSAATGRASASISEARTTSPRQIYALFVSFCCHQTRRRPQLADRQQDIAADIERQAEVVERVAKQADGEGFDFVWRQIKRRGRPLWRGGSVL